MTHEQFKWFNSIKQLFSNNKCSIALTEIEEYLEKYPTDNFAKFLYAQILLSAGDEYLDKAEKLFEAISYSNSNNRFSSQIELAKIYKKKGKLEEAGNLLLDVIENSNYNEQNARYLYANIKYEEEKYDEALKYIKNMKEQDNKYYVRLAKIYSIQNDKNNLTSALGKIKEEELTVDLLYDLLTVYKQMKEYDKALLIASKMKNVNITNNLYSRLCMEEAYIYLQLNENDLVVDKSFEVIESGICDKTKEIYLIMGDAYRNKADYYKAKESYQEALKSTQDSTKQEAVFRLGCLEQDVHHFEEAKKYYKDKLDDLKIASRYIKLIEIAIKEKNYEEADNYLTKSKKYFMKWNIGEYRIIKLLLDKKLNRPISFKDIGTYKESQVAHYSEEEAINHIIRHRNNKNPFSDSIKFKELYKYMKKKLTPDNLCYGELFDIYEVDYPGISDITNAKKCRVVVIPNTKNILTMYPDDNTRGYRNRIKDFKAVEEAQRREKETFKQKRYEKFYKNS